MWGASNKASGPAGRSPKGRGGGRASALLPLLDDVRHRLRRGASHLPARPSRQNVNLFLREPLATESRSHREIGFSPCPWVSVANQGGVPLCIQQGSAN